MRGTPFRKAHNLEEIGEQCLHRDGSLQGVVDKAVPLTPYAVRFRYPPSPIEPPLADAQKALRLATEVFEFVRQRLPGSGTP